MTENDSGVGATASPLASIFRPDMSTVAAQAKGVRLGAAAAGLLTAVHILNLYWLLGPGSFDADPLQPSDNDPVQLYLLVGAQTVYLALLILAGWRLLKARSLIWAWFIMIAAILDLAGKFIQTDRGGLFLGVAVVLMAVHGVKAARAYQQSAKAQKAAASAL